MYLIAEEDWVTYVPNNAMPWSAEIDDFLSDFGGYHPYFAVIGQSNMLYYTNWMVGPAIAAVPVAVASFSQIGVMNPIGNQALGLNDSETFDISELFIHPNGLPVNMSIQSNSNPDIVEAVIDNDMLTISSNDLTGISTIEILGVEDTLSCVYEFSVQVIDQNQHSIVIVDKDPTSTGDILQTSLLNYYSTGVLLADSFDTYPLTSNIDAVFVLLGIYSDNHELTGTEGAMLASYLDAGGNLYMEGGDTWCFDDQTAVHPYFNINPISDGSSDLSSVTGHDFLDGMSWTYSGENNWIDRIEPIEPAVTLFSNPTVGYNCGVAYDAGTYKTVGTSFEITGLGGTNTLDDAVAGILDFFGPFAVPLLPPTNLQVVSNPDEDFATLTWDEPASEELTGYNIYLDNFLSPVGNTTELEWLFTDLENGQTYTAGVTAVYDEGISDLVTVEFIFDGTSTGNNLPLVTELRGNYPNPFNPSTTIAFNVSTPGHVTLEIFNIKGEKVKTLVDGILANDSYTATWNGNNDAGKPVSSGVYFYKMKAGKYQETKKMILMK